MPGYDSAQRLKKDDDLGRWRFAAEIAEVIRSTPADWSARIGIFGKWGEGKSTVLHFLEEMLKPEGNIVLYFTPWTIQDPGDLWAEFGSTLLAALDKENLVVESPFVGTARKIQQMPGFRLLARLGEGTAEYFGKGRIYKTAFGLIGNWLKPDGAQVKKIRERLGSRRVIVFIGDHFGTAIVRIHDTGRLSVIYCRHAKIAAKCSESFQSSPRNWRGMSRTKKFGRHRLTESRATVS